jgi:hypothetical protein
MVVNFVWTWTVLRFVANVIMGVVIRNLLFNMWRRMHVYLKFLWFGDVNVKNIFTSHIDKKNISLTFFTSLSLYIFNLWKCIAYNFYISQLIRYARASSNYSDFLKRHLHLRNRLLDQGYKKIRLIRSLNCIWTLISLYVIKL